MAGKSFFSHIIRFISFLIALAIIITIAVFAAFMYFNAPAQPVTDTRILAENGGINIMADGSFIFEVRRGESAQSVGRRLERAGLIRNRYFWDVMFRFSDEFVRAGTYRIDPSMTSLAIYRLLVSGRQVLYRVTIPEGMTIRRTAQILEEAGITSAEAFIAAARDPAIIAHFGIPNNSMEGFLFPDTYMFPLNYPAALVVRAMADKFFTQTQEIFGQVNLSPQELNEIVTLASIVQGEYRLAEEAPLMAGVFHNRLRIGMRLQSCATVVYVITEILGREHPSRIFYIDLEIPSPFNTYFVHGLPPAPISSPGAVALRAAFAPAQTDYLFFRLIDERTGRHIFTRTLAEHNSVGLR